MPYIADSEEVLTFLLQAKKLIINGKYDFVPRSKNMQSLAQHGLTISDAVDELLELTINDYYMGPKVDNGVGYTGYIWEFKKDIEGVKFYIKLKIAQENDHDVLKCLSFHEAEYI